MKKSMVFGLVLLLLATLAGCRNSDIVGAGDNLSNQIAPCTVVSVASMQQIGDDGKAEGHSSGIVFSEDDEYVYIATITWGMEEYMDLSVSFDGETETPATIVNSDTQSIFGFLAVAKPDLEAKGVMYNLAIIGDSSKVQVGDDVVAVSIDHANREVGGWEAVLRGQICGIDKQVDMGTSTVNMLEADFKLLPGSAGGALVNVKGEIIGILAAVAMPPEAEDSPDMSGLSAFSDNALSYSIPINAIKVNRYF